MKLRRLHWSPYYLYLTLVLIELNLFAFTFGHCFLEKKKIKQSTLNVQKFLISYIERQFSIGLPQHCWLWDAGFPPDKTKIDHCHFVKGQMLLLWSKCRLLHWAVKRDLYWLGDMTRSLKIIKYANVKSLCKIIFMFCVLL